MQSPSGGLGEAEDQHVKRSTDNHAITNFLPRCMECRRGLAMRILSVRLSVCLTIACIVTKWKKNMSTFLYHTKYHLA